MELKPIFILFHFVLNKGAFCFIGFISLHLLAHIYNRKWEKIHPN